MKLSRVPSMLPVHQRKRNRLTGIQFRIAMHKCAMRACLMELLPRKRMLKASLITIMAYNQHKADHKPAIYMQDLNADEQIVDSLIKDSKYVDQSNK